MAKEFKLVSRKAVELCSNYVYNPSSNAWTYGTYNVYARSVI